MNEEEKELIEHIKESPTYREIMLLRIINKLQKENEELKNGKEPIGEFFMSKNGVVIKVVIDNRGEKEE